VNTQLIMWMNMPSHHQSAYFDALSAQVKLHVHYTGKQDNRRKKLGWTSPALKSFEHYTLFSLSQFFVLLKNRKSIHIITGCGSFANIFIWLSCLILRIKWCHLSENIPDTSLRSFLKNVIVKRYYKSINNSAFGAFAIGNKAKRSFERMNVNSSKIFITNYSSPINKKAEIKSLHPSPLRALILGELSYLKGTDIALEAINIYPDNLFVDFVGSVSKENQFFINEINLASNTSYQGIIASDKIEQLWSKYDFLIFSSREDGWGMVVHEAISNNTPVICSIAAGASEHLIIDKHNGLIIEPNLTSLKAALNLYIDNPQLLIKHSEYCSEHKLKFSPRATAQRFINDVNSALEVNV
jgi:glycosyltransferase involved in cell wall biosynthesis